MIYWFEWTTLKMGSMEKLKKCPLNRLSWQCAGKNFLLPTHSSEKNIFSQTTPNTSLNISSTHEEKDMDIEQGDDNQENIEVSYSTHLRERENVQKLLKGKDLMFVTLSVILYSQPLIPPPWTTLDLGSLVLNERIQIILKAESKRWKQ